MAEIFKHFSLSEDSFYLGQLQVNPINKEFDSETLNLFKEKAEEEGYKLGFNQGMTEGFDRGEKEARKQAALLQQQLENLLQTIPLALSESRHALKTEIADIVLAITQQFFVHQQQNKEAIAQQISSILNQLNDKQAITLALHPQDLTQLQQSELKIDFSHCKDLRIVADESLSLGGCIIKTEHGIFDAGIERQIDRLKQVLLQIKNRGSHD